MTAEMTGDEVCQPDGSEVRDDAGLLDASDTLDDRAGTEALDEGYSPPDRPWGVEHTGVTASERRRGESLDERLAEEVPDVRVPEGDGLGDLCDTDGELLDDEVGDARAGRLVAPDEGSRTNTVNGAAGRRAVTVRLTYVPWDPFAVAVDLPGDGGADGMRWHFARDLLQAGLHRPSGEGDVRIWPPCRCDARRSASCCGTISPRSCWTYRCSRCGTGSYVPGRPLLRGRRTTGATGTPGCWACSAGDRWERFRAGPVPRRRWCSQAPSACPRAGRPVRCGGRAWSVPPRTGSPGRTPLAPGTWPTAASLGQGPPDMRTGRDDRT
ncbi:hypothetical protein SUDANB145_00058 [Streptomyces sp. enrichment culture]|uniref:SsgA family sporulation/cell division regulator n=1 Tax=Streptomyces sp. enrichment culture TaxID=1795815 RepID=UPI003F576ED2